MLGDIADECITGLKRGDKERMNGQKERHDVSFVRYLTEMKIYLSVHNSKYYLE